MTRDIRVGFIGFGEVGFKFSKGLHQEGLSQIFAFDRDLHNEKYGSLIQGRADEAGVEMVENYQKLSEKCNIIFCAVPSFATVQVAKDFSCYLNMEHLYIDLTAAKMDSKEEIAKLVKSRNARFIDAQIVAPVPQNGHKSTLFVSGDDCDVFKVMLGKYGMDIRVISENAGDASRLKMLRSVFTKGLEALLLEVVVSARKFNADKIIIDSISETMDSVPFKQTINRYICEDAIHAERRVHELDDVTRVLESKGVRPIMVRAARERINWSAGMKLKEYFEGKPPISLEEVLKVIDNKFKLE